MRRPLKKLKHRLSKEKQIKRLEKIKKRKGIRKEKELIMEEIKEAKNELRTIRRRV